MIRSLGEDVRSLLRSGIAISNLTQCIDELVVNSLDAGATCITVRIDIPALRIQITDNGCGISRDDLDILGERYATSKCHSLNDLNDIKCHGFRGEALASIRDIAGILEFVTRHKSSYKTYCKTFRSGKVLKITESCIPRSNVGTTVTAYDVFASLPVRQKLISDLFDFEKIRQRLASIALINPGVSFSLYNDATGQKCLQTRKCQSMTSTFSQLFGNLKAKSLHEVTLASGNVQISGYICVQTHHSKSLQFVYVNGRLLMKTKIHKLVNQIFHKSVLLRRPTLLHDGQVEQLKPPPKQGSEKYGIFVLNIKCPVMDYDITLEPGKTLVEFEDWDGILQVVKKCTESFLIKENLMLQVDEDNEPVQAEDLSDSQVDLSVYEYQSCIINNTTGNDYCINPGNIKKSLQSSVVSRNTNQSCDDDVELTEKTEMLNNERFVNASKDCKRSQNEVLSHSTTAHTKISKANFPQRAQPSSLLEKATRQFSFRNCFTSLNPITLQLHRAKKRAHCSVTNKTVNIPDHSMLRNTHSNSTEVSKSTSTENSHQLEKECIRSCLSITDRSKNFDDDDDDTQPVAMSDCCSSVTKESCFIVDVEDVYDGRLSVTTSGDCTSGLNEDCSNVTLQSDPSTDHINSVDIVDRIESNNLDSSSSVSKDWQIMYDNNLQRNIYFNIHTGNTLLEHPVTNGESLQNTDNQINTNQHKSRNSGPAPLPCAQHISFDCTPWLPRDNRQGRTSHQVNDVRLQERESPSTRQHMASLVSLMLDEWKNPIFESVAEMDVTKLSKPTVIRSGVALHNAVDPYRFTKEMVKSLHVIQQVDNKFIICQSINDEQCDSLIVLLDQHAVHERIRLENLLSDLFVTTNQSENSSLPIVKSSAISPPIELEFTPHEFLLIKRFHSELERVGIKLVIDYSSESSVSQMISVHKLPSVFVEREVSETRRRRPSIAVVIVKELIESHIEHLKQTNGVSPALPKTILRVLCSQACHGAIKFGEALSKMECQNLLQQLSVCNLPFQCAHGRPSIIPLVDLKLLRSKQLKTQTDCQLPNLRRLTSKIIN